MSQHPFGGPYGHQPYGAWPPNDPAWQQPGTPPPPPGPPYAPGHPAPHSSMPPRPPAHPAPATPVPSPEPKRAVYRPLEMPVTTGELLPDAVVAQVLGPVFGVALRARDMKVGLDTAAQLAAARQDAVAAMVTMAARAGAQAVVGLRFDGGRVSAAQTEVCAYGTAVVLQSVTEPTQEETMQGSPDTEREGLTAPRHATQADAAASSPSTDPEATASGSQPDVRPATQADAQPPQG